MPGGYRAALAAAIAVVLVAGVTAAVLVDPSSDDQEARSPGPASTQTEASRALCAELNASIQTVKEGRQMTGGLRLSRALNTYEGTAEPSVVNPTRRLLAGAVRGDLDIAAGAADEAARACARLGSPLEVGG